MLYFCQMRVNRVKSCIIEAMNKTELLRILEAETAIIWDMFCEIYPKLTRFDPPTIVLNGRFTKTAGCCEVENNRIQIGTKFFDKFENEMLNVILPHEIAHQVDYNLNGLPKNNRWHGANWQIIMVAYGLEPHAYHSLEI